MFPHLERGQNTHIVSRVPSAGFDQNDHLVLMYITLKTSTDTKKKMTAYLEKKLAAIFKITIDVTYM